MSISIASLHTLWDRNKDKPQHLFMLVIPQADPQPYISVAYFPGGWLAAKWCGLPMITYNRQAYVPLTCVEQQRRKIFHSIWRHFQSIMGDEAQFMACPVSW